MEKNTGGEETGGGSSSGGPDINQLAEEARRAFTTPGTGGHEPTPAGTTPPDADAFFRPPDLLDTAAEGQPEQSRNNAFVDKVAGVLEKTKAFGKSLARFASKSAVPGVVRIGARELAKGIFSWSGAAAAVGGGVAGTMAVGAFAGAVAGAAVEYVRQINKNLDQRLAGVPEADPELVGRKQAFFQKIEGLRHKEAYKADFRKIGKAALFGAVVGAGAGALIEHIPQLTELIRNVPGVQGVGDIAGGIGHAAGETLGNAGKTAGDVLGGAGKMAENMPGAGYSGLEGIPQPDLTEVAGNADQAAHEAIKQVPTGFVPQADMVYPLPPDFVPQGDMLGQAVVPEDIGGTAAAAAKEQALEALKSNPDFLQSTAAAVGEQLPQSNAAVEEAIRAAGMDPGQLSAEAYENIRTSVQHKMEALANQSFAHAAESVAVPDASHLAEIAKQGHDEFIASLANNPDTQQQLLKSASEALTDHLTAVEQAVAHAQSALDNFGDHIPLPAGSNPWEVSAGILKQMGVVNPSPEQIMQLDKVICQASGISVPEWGIPGAIDAHQLPVGFNINLTDEAKKIALGIASRK